MRKVMKVKYDAVKNTVKQLQITLDTEVVKNSQNRYSEVEDLLENMSGATRDALLLNIQMSQIKTKTNADALQKILNFIRSSAQTVENREKHMANQFYKKR